MTELPEGPMLLLSPHLDDAVLSCAALLARETPIDVLTVFAGEPDPPQRGSWDELTGFASSAESMPARRAEDRAAFSDTPHRVEMMPLLEAQYVRGPRSHEDATAIATAVSMWSERTATGAVAAPAGAGRRPGPDRLRLRRLLGHRCGGELHPDHVYVRDAAVRAVTALPRTALILYEELPYTWGGSPERDVRRIARSRRYELARVVVPIDRAAKAARIAAYASQVPHFCANGMRLDEPENLPKSERYWLLTRPTTRSSEPEPR